MVEVNAAVNHMDQATPQSAAMVEQTNAAGAGCAQESTNLNDLLQQFQLGLQIDSCATWPAGCGPRRQACAGGCCQRA